MKRFGMLGIPALLGLLLIGALGASSASAAKFVSEIESTNFKSSSESQQISFAGGSATSCSGPSLTGTAKGKEATAGYASKSFASSETTTPFCSSAKMTWNGCKVIFHPPSEGTSKGSVEIGPSGCGPVVFVRTTFGCEYTIPAQTGIGATYTGYGSGTGRTISVAINTSSLKYTQVKGGGCGPLGTFSNGAWVANLTLSGTNAKSEAVGIWVAKLPVGVRVGGEKSENPSESPHFVSVDQEETLIKMTGELTSKSIFTTINGGTPMECSTAGLTSELPGPSTSLDVSVAYTCSTFLGSPLTIDMNSCRYVFAIENAGPPYVGTAQVACAEKGDVIDFTVGSICAYTLAPQQLGVATYSSTGKNNEMRILASVKGSGLTITRTMNKFLCPIGNGTGTFSGGFSLGGVE